VADEASRRSGPFDVPTIRHLVALMSRHDLSEIDLREGDLRIRLRRGPHGVILPPAPPAGPLPTASSVPAPNPVAAPAGNSQAEPSARNLHLIKSPTIGTFYARSKPEAEPYVKVGSRVTPTTVVCLIEAMKLFNEITAECTGVITEILAENQQPVEYGQVLFKVDTTA
jgi:acetyl-CoA carboxylase biotin carboxyl carrier protein